jgi:preprotein translocase subunit YajC
VSAYAGPAPGPVAGHCLSQVEGSPAMGNMIFAASTKSTGGTNLLPIILIVVLFMLVYMTMSRRSRAKRAQQVQNDIVPGTRVRTTSGMYGTISSIEGDDVMLEVAPGVNVRVMRRAVVPVPMDASMGATGPNAANGTGPAAEPETDSDTGDEEPRTEDRDPQDRNV